MATPYGYANWLDAVLDFDPEDWAEKPREPIALRLGKKVIEAPPFIEMWMVVCESCGMLSGSHFCDGKVHAIGWVKPN